MNILITGASSGIGRQLALDFCTQGHQVWGLGRDSSRLQAIAKQGVKPLQVELGDLQALRELVLDLPAMDIVVLGAGSCEYLDPQRFDASLFERVWQNNVQSMANCLDALWSQLKPGAQLALVGSLAHLLPFSQAGAYGSSKAAIHYLAHALRTDLAAKQVSVHCIQPGFVKTPLTDKNHFSMPYLISVEQASQAIIKGLSNGRLVINFPTAFSCLLRLLHALPLTWQNKICCRLARKEGTP
ncbi:SDR family NAD(P)-dependent oxidoreductase [Agarivorans sp. QJM3NY_33]|uniref:SDR family NAD(P)-dependent oxidoreductase n=1 Tax=Agarivorans sp. QJM3NY_33 TaxID=3421432 RepID=UPI003D7D2348